MPTENQDFTVSPSGNQTAEVGTVSQFTFSGITSSTVDIMLTGCENVTTNENGVSTFPNSSNPGGSGNVANEGGVTGASISVINGTADAAGVYKNDATVSNGSVSFTVNNTGVDCYVAVVFDDANDDNNLNLGTDNQPTEDFANSGDVNVIAQEAGDNAALNQVEVATLDKAADRFSSTTATYYYDSNDEFLLDVDGNSPGTTTDDTVLTMEQFEARISAGDNVSGTYRSNPANQSTFRLNDDSPAAPAGVDAKQPDGTTNAGKAGVEIEWTDSTTATVASYNIYRATATQPTAIGGSVTCPSRTSGAFSQIANVADTKTSGTYEYLDTTAQQPATGSDPANPQYCYYVTSVDQTGDESAPSTGDTSPTPAFPASTTTAMAFQAAGSEVVNALSVTVDYTQTVNADTVAANGSDYDVTATTGTVSEDLTIVSAAKDGSDPDNVDILLSEPIPAGSTVTVTQRTGTDTNTVCAGTGTTNCAPAGQTVQLSSGDVEGPTATDAAFVDTAAGAAGVFGDEDGDEITVTYDEAVVVDGVGTITIDGTTYTESADLTIEPGGSNTLVVTVVDNTAVADTPITDGVSEVEGTTNVEDADGNPADGYPEPIN